MKEITTTMVAKMFVYINTVFIKYKQQLIDNIISKQYTYTIYISIGVEEM